MLGAAPAAAHGRVGTVGLTVSPGRCLGLIYPFRGDLFVDRYPLNPLIEACFQGTLGSPSTARWLIPARASIRFWIGTRLSIVMNS